MLTVTDKQHKLLGNVISSSAGAPQNKSKAKVTQSVKKPKTLDFLVVEVFVGRTYSEQ